MEDHDCRHPEETELINYVLNFEMSFPRWSPLPVSLCLHLSWFMFSNFTKLNTASIKPSIIYLLILLPALSASLLNLQSLTVTQPLRPQLNLDPVYNYQTPFIWLPVAQHPCSHYRPHLNFRLSTGVSTEASGWNKLSFLLMVYVCAHSHVFYHFFFPFCFMSVRPNAGCIWWAHTQTHTLA